MVTITRLINLYINARPSKFWRFCFYALLFNSHRIHDCRVSSSFSNVYRYKLPVRSVSTSFDYYCFSHIIIVIGYSHYLRQQTGLLIFPHFVHPNYLMHYIWYLYYLSKFKNKGQSGPYFANFK